MPYRFRQSRIFISPKEYDEEDIALLRKCLKVRALPESWKEYFRERLANIGET